MSKKYKSKRRRKRKVNKKTQKRKRRNILPKLRKIDYTKKKHRYHIKDPFSKRS